MWKLLVALLRGPRGHPLHAMGSEMVFRFGMRVERAARGPAYEPDQE